MNFYATFGTYHEARIVARSEFAQEILKLLDNDTINSFDLERKLRKKAKKAIRAERRYFDASST